MENTNTENKFQSAPLSNHWQQAESEENKIEEQNSDQNWDLRSPEAGGFGVEEDQEEQSIYASAAEQDDPRKEDSDQEEADEEEEESADTDWGTVDPQEHPGIPSDMDPSGPGSAV